ncbi:helix-turn-helix domain-containing protein [Saccharothrix sp. MB29]|nr:helix-turn-helix domain-containing protein [Saccharothrix sp. MB29]
MCLTDVLAALSDPLRVGLVRLLADGEERNFGEFAVPVAKSTLSHHLKVLNTAGLTWRREEGTRCYVRLRRDDVDARFPHLLDTVLAAADRAPRPALADLAATATRLAVLEGVGDHENLGSLFRNAAALGVDGVVLGPGCSDPLYRRSVRVSMGHVLRVPFTHAHDFADGLDTLRDNGFTVAALTPRADAVSLADAGLRGRRVAVMLGSEGPGLTDEAIAAADVAVRIPMADGVDSLNVATAGAIAFYAIA